MTRKSKVMISGSEDAAITAMATSVPVNPERTQLAEALVEVKIESADQLLAVVEALASAMDAIDELTGARKKATAPIRAQLDAALEPYKAPVTAEEAVKTAAKAAIIRTLRADDASQLAAILAQQPVPAPRALPQGLVVSRGLELDAIDMSVLPEEYTTRVADVDAILAAFGSGKDVPGAKVVETIDVQFRRK